MCTSIIEIAPAEGMAKRGDEWFELSHSVVAYDHARHAALGDVITLDFINTAFDPGARAGVELTLADGSWVGSRLRLHHILSRHDSYHRRRRRRRSGSRSSGGWSHSAACARPRRHYSAWRASPAHAR